MPRDWDYLVHLHLEGSLEGEEARVFAEGLRVDAALRRRLAEMAYDQAQLPDALAADEPVEAPRAGPEAVPAFRRWWERLGVAAAVILAGAVIVLVTLSGGEEPAIPVAPVAAPIRAARSLPFVQVDTNRDGRVSRAEYAAYLEKLDRDGDGAITPSEFSERE